MTAEIRQINRFGNVKIHPIPLLPPPTTTGGRVKLWLLGRGHHWLGYFLTAWWFYLATILAVGIGAGRSSFWDILLAVELGWVICRWVFSQDGEGRKSAPRRAHWSQTMNFTAEIPPYYIRDTSYIFPGDTDEPT